MSLPICDELRRNKDTFNFLKTLFISTDINKQIPSEIHINKDINKPKLVKLLIDFFLQPEQSPPAGHSTECMLKALPRRPFLKT